MKRLTILIICLMIPLVASAGFWGSIKNFLDPVELSSTIRSLPQWVSKLSGSAIAPRQVTDIVLVGTSTTSINTIFQVVGSSTISGNITAANLNISNWDTTYSIVNASSSLWQSFYDTPSTRITAGDFVSWTGNTLNVSNSWWNADEDISPDAISESKIIFSTACGPGNHYYLNGNDLACEADDDTHNE